MTGHIRKHQKWLWYFISAAVIISFVVYFTPGSRLGGGGGGGGSYGSMDGRPIRSAEVGPANRATQFDQALQDRSRKQSADQATYINLLLLARATELGIEVSDSAAAAWMRQNLRDANGPIPYDKIVERFIGGPNSKSGLTEEHLRDWLGLQVSRGHLTDLTGVAGELVTPREATLEYQRENESLVVSVAQFSSSNYLASVNLDPAAIGQFYTNRLAVYRIPERSVLSFVRFETTNHLAQAQEDLRKLPDLTNHLEQAYSQRGASSFMDELGQPLTKAAAMAKLYEATLNQRALELANLKAREFANALYKLEKSPASLASLAQTRGLKLATTEPFAESGRPAALDDIQSLPQAMTKLSMQQPFTAPLMGTRGVVVAALTSTLPGEIPPFASVQTRVTEDYKRFKGQEAARAEGEAFATSLTNGLAQGKGFAAVAAERLVKPVDLPPFLLSEQVVPGIDPRVVNTLKGAVYNLKAGTASGLLPTADGGMVVYLKERRAVDEATLKAGLNNFLQEQRQQRKEYAFQEWLTREFEKSGLAERFKRETAEQ